MNYLKKRYEVQTSNSYQMAVLLMYNDGDSFTLQDVCGSDAFFVCFSFLRLVLHA